MDYLRKVTRMSLTTKVIAGAGGLVMALGLGTGIASAEPNVEAVVNSTCTYPQVIAALQAQDPAAANQLLSSGLATGFLQSLVNAPPGSDARRQLIGQVAAYPEFASYATLINTVATSCQNY